MAIMDIINRINNTAFGYNQQTATINKRYPVFDENETKDYKQSEIRFGEGQFAVPLRLALSSSPDDVFSLPLDPVVVVKGSNSIVRREIAKAVVEGDEIRGTVKELWTQDDWSISVSGILMTTGDADDESVSYYHDRLLRLLTAKESLVIECDVLNNIYNVTRVVVESFDFPFTKGIENQSFTISMLSDDSYDLEVK